MKKKHVIAIAAVAVLLVLGISVAVWMNGLLAPWTAEKIKPDHTAKGEVSALAPIPEGSDYTMMVAENEHFQLLAREDGKIAVVSKETGTIWHSNPLEKDAKAVGVNMTNLNSQLYITYASEGGKTTTKNSTTDCVNKEWLTWEGIVNGIRYLYDFQVAGIQIPVEYVLEEDGLRAMIVVDEIVEGTKEQYLTEIAFLPFFGAMSTESNGYTLVPDGSGALIYHNNEKATYGAYKQAVYGRDTALVLDLLTAEEETVRLPIFGMTNGKHGYVAVIDAGDGVATINAMTSGTINSYNNAYASFRFRPYTMATFYQGNTYAHDGVGDSQQTLMLPSVQPAHMDFTVKYILMEQDELTYVDMAETYRDHLIANGSLADTASAQEAPLYLELLGGVTKEDVVLGVKLPVMQTLTTFKEAEKIVGALRDGGVDDMLVKYTGWQSGGMESKIPAKISFESKLGGSKGYKAFAEYAKNARIDLFMDFDFLNFYQGGNGLSTFTDSVQTIENTPTYIYTYDDNTMVKDIADRWRLLTPRMAVSAVQEMLKEREKLEDAHLSLSTMGTTVYSDFTKKANGIDRANASALWQAALSMASEASGQLMVDGGNAYALPYTTHVYDAPMTCTLFDIEDEAVPFYQIVLHGYLSYSTEPLNLSSDPQRTMLKALETGSSLAACLMAADNHVLEDTHYDDVYSGNYELWLSVLCESYGQTSEILKAVANAPIIDHRKLAENVYRTTYANGDVVYVNYGQKAVEADGQHIEAKGFAYLSGKEAQ